MTPRCGLFVALGIFCMVFLDLAQKWLPTFSTTAAQPQQPSDPNNDHLAIVDEVIAKWKLTNNPQTKQLLTKIWYKDNRYDPQRDLIVFYHPLKSGGTSLSEVLEGLGGVVPSSHRSNFFNEKEFQTKFDKDMKSGEWLSPQDWWASRRVLFSHTSLRAYQSTTNLPLANFFQSQPHHKRLRLITMIREPVAFVASNYNEWFCTLRAWTKTADELQLPRPANTTACSGYTLQDLAQARIQTTHNECHDITPKQLKEAGRRKQQRCKFYQQHGPNKDPIPNCGSLSVFMESFEFDRFFGRIFGEFTTPAPNATADDCSIGALEYLGGLDVPVGESDVMWFGVTERMHESVCLFHYQTGLKWIQTPQHRVFADDCAPTRFWSDQDRARFQSLRQADYTVHQVANAILDLQLTKMRLDLWTRIIQNKWTLDDMPFTTAECLGPKPEGM